jgi:hypothetical protein
MARSAAVPFAAAAFREREREWERERVIGDSAADSAAANDPA